MHEPSLSQRRARFGCLLGTLRPSRLQIRCTRFGSRASPPSAAALSPFDIRSAHTPAPDPRSAPSEPAPGPFAWARTDGSCAAGSAPGTLVVPRRPACPVRALPLHAAVLTAPAVVGVLADRQLPARILDARAACQLHFCFSQLAHDLLSTVSPRKESQRPVAHGQNHCQRGRDDECLAARSGTGVAEITLGQACSAPSNRVVRTRMLRGVGGGRSDPPAYPIRQAAHTDACRLQVRQWTPKVLRGGLHSEKHADSDHHHDRDAQHHPNGGP